MLKDHSEMLRSAIRWNRSGSLTGKPESGIAGGRLSPVPEGKSDMMKTQRPFQSSPGKHRVFLVEDHPVTQQGFSMLLNMEADLMVVAGPQGRTGL